MQKVHLITIFLMITQITFATTNHIAKTYQPFFDPQADGEYIYIVPVYFITLHATPYTEINAICIPNALTPRWNFIAGGNGNAASLCGIEAVCDEYNGKQVDVTLNLTKLAMHEAVCISEELLMHAVIECAKKTVEELGYEKLAINIIPRENDPKNKWTAFEKTYTFSQDEEAKKKRRLKKDKIVLYGNKVEAGAEKVEK